MRKEVLTSTPNTGSPIQRLLLVHWTLAELSTGQSLSDGASEAELGEEILYYYQQHGSRESMASDVARDESNRRQEVISFAGLCRALYTLPEAMGASGGASDRTRDVLLDNCRLTFVPLVDERGLVVAIVQTARPCTPSAVRATIERSHQMFCLLRGGGIHRRLSAKAVAGVPTGSDATRYPGMAELYRVRRQERKIASQARNNPNPLQERKRLQEEICSVYEGLPLSLLRRELRVHYDAFLGELSQLSSVSNGSIFRRIVEEIPAPTLHIDGSRPPCSTSVLQMQRELLVDAFRDFLCSRANLSDGGMPKALGVAIFVHESLVATNTVADAVLTSSGTTVLLFRYMSSLRCQMLSPRNSQASSRSSTPTRPKKGLSQLMFSLGDRLDTIDLPLHGSSQARSSYLEPPPLSLLSTLDDTNSFEGPEEGTRVWAVPVTFMRPMEADDLEEEEYTDARVSLYVSGIYSFLLYLNLTPDAEGGDACFVEVFRQFMEHCTKVLDDLNPQVDCSLDNDGTMLPCAPRVEPSGCEVVFVDWNTNSHFVFSEKVDSPERDRRHQLGGLGTMFNGKRANSEQLRDANALSIFGLDCRHILASRLTLDSLLALEDAMDSIRSRERDPFETCTSLSSHWLYAYACNQQEVYLLADATKYVTIADVQRCARGIRDELFSRI